MKSDHGKFFPSLLFGLLASLLPTLPAGAEEGKIGPRTSILPAYRQECAACHVAYPPGMLPKASWQRLTGNLTRHFGVDASLDAATLNELSQWLGANAGTYRRVREEPPQDRITLAAWFVREHREVPTDTWKRADVKSAANCGACHTQADKGDFNERNVRVPR